MDPVKKSGSRDVSKETPRQEETFKDADERAPRLATKALPPFKAGAPLPYQPSVSSTAGTNPHLAKHPQLPPSGRPSQLSDAAVGDPPTPRMHNPPPRYEVNARAWDAKVSVVWARFPEHKSPVLGWLREGASPYRDAFFGSDGTMRSITREEITPYLLPYSVRIDDPRPPNSVALHPTLRHSLEDALKTRDYLRDPRSNTFYPIASEKDWRRIAYPGSSLSLDYHFMCSICLASRLVRRADAPVVESLPDGYEFKCADVGVECSVEMLIPCEFLPRAYRPISTSSIPPRRLSLNAENLAAFIKPEHEEGYGEAWRKRMKFWPGITSYDGTASLVELKGWRSMMEEAYERVGVPPGRDRVLQAIKYLTGDAEKWWRSIAGQPRGQSLMTFEALYEAMERRFIPRSVYQKAIKDWNSLRQTGTAEEYMRRVDELATVQPLGEVAEYWHAWEGMRPELKAEVQFRLQEQGRQTCSRDELWTLMWNAETCYPIKAARPFPSRVPFKSVPLRAVATSASPSVVCWICDAPGHRATTCPKRMPSGCARCGSKAHELLVCPQRPDPRKSAAARSERAVAASGGKKTRSQNK